MGPGPRPTPARRGFALAATGHGIPMPLDRRVASRVSLRLPSGDFEIRYLNQVPQVGDTMSIRKQRWVVEDVKRDDGGAAIRVRPADRSTP
jgi:hypothetical protein